MACWHMLWSNANADCSLRLSFIHAFFTWRAVDEVRYSSSRLDLLPSSGGSEVDRVGEMTCLLVGYNKEDVKMQAASPAMLRFNTGWN